MGELEALQRRMAYEFADRTLLTRALTHRSRGADNNERLEFLGDSILGFVVAEWLYQNFPDIAEGQLSRMRSTVVRKQTLAGIARGLQLQDALFVGEGEQKSGGANRDSILADAMEAVIGAVYLDSGIDSVKELVSDQFQPALDLLSTNSVYKDPKSRLQEYLQQRGFPVPVYEIVGIEGEAHCQVFEVACSVAGYDQRFLATGLSRRSAEQSAAEKAFSALND